MYINLSNKLLDEFDMKNYSYLVDKSQYYKKSGIQEYRLYSYLSTWFNNCIILDIGTYQGTSAIALSHNDSNTVKSYNINDNIKNIHHPIYTKKNIEFYIENGVSVINNLTKEDICNIKIIMIDTEHYGDEEQKMIDKIISLNYSGIIILDDIHHPNPELKPLMEKLWNNITYKKYDLTKYGHYSGTGIILINTDIDFILS